MVDSGNYVLQTGQDAAYRLSVVQEVHGPDTRALLLRAGLSEGGSIADVGCGAGYVSRWIAETIGPGGSLVCLDSSADQLAVARATLAEAPCNVDFVQADATATGLPDNSFDLVFARFVLMHLPDPLAALRELVRLTKPGGILAVEDGDFSSLFCHPPLPEFDEMARLYREVVRARGADPLMGRGLYALFLEAGVVPEEVRLVQPVFVRGDAKRLPEWTLEECSDAVEAAGLADRETIARIVARLAAHAEDHRTLFAMARMTQVWAVKPGVSQTSSDC